MPSTGTNTTPGGAMGAVIGTGRVRELPIAVEHLAVLGDRHPEDWVTTAALSFLGVGIISHVAVGLRWPFALKTK
jgi:hypothetical protein